MEKNFFQLPKVIIDTHVHGRDLHQAYKTTVEQTLKEASTAGISISFFMPNLPIINRRQLQQYLYLMQSAQKTNKIACEQYLYFGGTDSNMDECEEALKFTSVVGIKIYPKLITTREDHNKLGVTHKENILKIMHLAQNAKKVVAVHCDNAQIVKKEGHTIKAEIADVENIITLAKMIPGVKIVICHVSCLQSAERILEAQKEGLNIAIELTPQHLWFSNDGCLYAQRMHRNAYYMINPIRSRRHTEFLYEIILNDNDLVFIGSDTACHTKKEKIAGTPGIPSNQELIAVMITLAKQFKISEQRIAELISFNQAKFFNLEVPQKLIKTEIEFKQDLLPYNNGKVINPWNQTKLWFPKY